MDRLKKIAFRHGLASSENLEPYEVILAEDRSLFDSSTLCVAFAALPEVMQRQIQVGYQFVGRTAYHPVIVSEYAEAHFGSLKAGLPGYITYVTSKFEKLRTRALELANRKQLSLSFATTGGDVYIEQYRCRILCESLVTGTKQFVPLTKILGYNMSVAICSTTANKFDHVT